MAQYSYLNQRGLGFNKNYVINTEILIYIKIENSHTKNI